MFREYEGDVGRMFTRTITKRKAISVRRYGLIDSRFRQLKKRHEIVPLES